jgi:hypothetical protein
VSGFHLLSSDGAFPPKKYERFPIFSCEQSSKISRCAVHLLHRNRKCSIVSGAWPHSHSSDSTTPILWRKHLSLAMPVLNCTRMLRQRHVNIHILFFLESPFPTSELVRCLQLIAIWVGAGVARLALPHAFGLLPFLMLVSLPRPSSCFVQTRHIVSQLIYAAAAAGAATWLGHTTVREGSSVGY